MNGAFHRRMVAPGMAGVKDYPSCARRARVVAAGMQERLDWILAIERHKLVAQGIVGRVQRDGDRPAFRAEPGDLGRDARSAMTQLIPRFRQDRSRGPSPRRVAAASVLPCFLLERPFTRASGRSARGSCVRPLKSRRLWLA
jgi:hypothetical protein